MILGIYGAGGLGREILELVRQIEAHKKRWDNICFVVDEQYMTPNIEPIHGVMVCSFTAVLQKNTPKQLEFTIALGEPVYRKEIYDRIKERGYHCAVLIHPNVYIPKSTTLAEGVIVQTHAVISCDVVIEENTLIQNAASVGHDAHIGAHSVISTNAAIAGHCYIGDETYLALNVSIKENITIGNSSIVGMGAVVIHDIQPNMVAAGNPARILKQRDKSSRVFKG